MLFLVHGWKLIVPRFRDLLRSFIRLARRGGLLALGWVLAAAGLAIMPTPVPIGLVMFIAGLMLLARESETARRGIRWARRRLPVLSNAMNKAAPRLPAGLRVFVESTDPVLDAAPGE